MIEYEYATKEVEKCAMGPILQEMGAQGWQLSAVTPGQVTGYVLFFQRPKTPEKIETPKKPKLTTAHG